MSPFSSIIVTNAEIVATVAHSAIGQVRKYTGDPYIVHPRAVVELVKTAAFVDEAMLATAWLHDVPEDTRITTEQIARWFGIEIGDMVWFLTNMPMPGKSRRERFEINTKRLAQATPRTKTVKVCDLIDNTSTIVDYDAKFATLYLSEKLELLETALRGADEGLWQRAWDQCREHQAKLGQAA